MLDNPVGVVIVIVVAIVVIGVILNIRFIRNWVGKKRN